MTGSPKDSILGNVRCFRGKSYRVTRMGMERVAGSAEAPSQKNTLPLWREGAGAR